MATWATIEQARQQWADASDDDALLTWYLDVAQEALEFYAPALVDGAPTPKRYTTAVIQQARETVSNMARDGDVLGFDGEYAIRVRPLAASVKALLRPKRGRPRFGHGGALA